MRLKYEEKRVRDLGIGSDDLTLINKENQIVGKFLSRQDVGGFKSVVLAIDLRLKHGMHRDSVDLPTSVRIVSPSEPPSSFPITCGQGRIEVRSM